MSNENPLLRALRFPGETYRLPSRGLFYKEGVLDPMVRDGEVEVIPMTAVDEIVLNTPDRILSGKAVVEVIGRCVPSILQPGELLISDVDFLLVCLRYVSFGAEMDVTYTHNCEHAREHTYTVNVMDIIRNTTSVDPTTFDQTYQIKMKNGQVVKLQPITYSRLIKLFQTTAYTKTTDLTEDETKTIIINSLAGIVASVDGIADEQLIREWVENLPLGMKKTLQEYARDAMNQWGVDFTIKTQCKDCGEIFDLVVNPNPVSFFS